MLRNFTSLLGLLLLAGCGGSGLDLQPVTGTVTYKDQPVKGAEVIFVPANDQPNAQPARAKTDADGAFSLSTYVSPEQDERGILAGRYNVTVSKLIIPPGGADPYQGRKAKNELPPRYAAANTSGLTAEVTTDGPNAFEFKLVDGP